MKSIIFCMIILISIIITVVISCSTGDREINSNQLQKREDGFYYAVNEEKPYTGKVVQLYENGQQCLEQTFQNGSQSGPYRTWYENGQKEIEGTYKNGLKDGQWISYYANGQRESEIKYENGEVLSEIEWTEEGEIINPELQVLTNDLLNLASRAQQYYVKPESMGGGNNSFNKLNNIELLFMENYNFRGEYSVIENTDTYVKLKGVGFSDIDEDGQNVTVTVKVTPDHIQTEVLSQ